MSRTGQAVEKFYFPVKSPMVKTLWGLVLFHLTHGVCLVKILFLISGHSWIIIFFGELLLYRQKTGVTDGTDLRVTDGTVLSGHMWKIIRMLYIQIWSLNLGKKNICNIKTFRLNRKEQKDVCCVHLWQLKHSQCHRLDTIEKGQETYWLLPIIHYPNQRKWLISV